MRTISLILVLFVNLLLPGTSHSQWEWSHPLPQGNTLNDVHYSNQNAGWAVGDAGTILKSENGGNSYELMNYPSHANFSTVKFLNPNSEN